MAWNAGQLAPSYQLERDSLINISLSHNEREIIKNDAHIQYVFYFNLKHTNKPSLIDLLMQSPGLSMSKNLLISVYVNFFINHIQYIIYFLLWFS